MNKKILFAIAGTAALILYADASLAADSDAEKKCQEEMIKGARLCAELDYAEAEKVLSEAAKTCSADQTVSRSIRSAILEQLAIALAALSKDDDAEEAFLRLIELDPEYALDEGKASPKIANAFKRAKRRAPLKKNEIKTDIKTETNEDKKTELKTETKTEKSEDAKKNDKTGAGIKAEDKKDKPEITHAAPKKNEPKPFELSLKAGLSLPFGDDLKNFGGGVHAQASFNYSFAGYFFTGADLRYEAHPSSALASNEKLHVAALTAAVGFKYVYKFFSASLWPYFGAAGFGLDDPFASFGFAYGAGAGADFKIFDAAAIGFSAEFMQITTPAGESSSLALLLAKFGFDL